VRPGAPSSPPAPERKPRTPSIPSTPPTLPPGLTLREHLSERIRAPSRWLRGRYEKDPEGSDHEELLQSLLAPASTVIRRPPLAARRLLQENRRSTASLTSLAEIIESDPALLQSVLKHANSAFYAAGVGGRPILAVPAALQRIGARGVEIVVMAHLVEGSLCRPGEGLDELAGAIWSHMLRVAPVARALAPAFRVHPDEGYALGLLHDVGKLVLFTRVADLRRRLRRPVRLAPGFISAALKKLHEPLGALAVLEWGMGDQASLAVAHHHRTPPIHPPHLLSELIFMAEKLDIFLERGVDPELEPIWIEGRMTAPMDEVMPLWNQLRSRLREEMEIARSSVFPPPTPNAGIGSPTPRQAGREEPRNPGPPPTDPWKGAPSGDQEGAPDARPDLPEGPAGPPGEKISSRT
jgi:HD-like signal output (HDOD) protein